MKGNYNHLFVTALKKAGYDFTLKVKPKEQPTMGLLSYDVTGDPKSLKDEITFLKEQLEVYKRRYSALCRSIKILNDGNPIPKGN